MLQSVAQREPKLDYETPRKRVRFLEKLNPKATPRTVIRAAMIYGTLGAIAGFLMRHLNHHWRYLHWTTLVGLSLLAGGVGAVCEWQQRWD